MRRILFAILVGIGIDVLFYPVVTAATIALVQNELRVEETPLAALVMAIGVVPGVVMAALIAAPDGDPEHETRCRKCRYILRGISEPRCPECGERI